MLEVALLKLTRFVGALEQEVSVVMTLNILPLLPSL